MAKMTDWLGMAQKVVEETYYYYHHHQPPPPPTLLPPPHYHHYYYHHHHHYTTDWDSGLRGYDPWKLTYYVPSKRRNSLTRQLGVTARNTPILSFTAVKNNPRICLITDFPTPSVCAVQFGIFLKIFKCFGTNYIYIYIYIFCGATDLLGPRQLYCWGLHT